ncbi:MAG: hypothetical protein AABW80_05100 [Nanoarchaeota archaeon]
MEFWKKAVIARVGFNAAKSLIKEVKKTDTQREMETFADKKAQYSFTISTKLKQDNIYGLLKKIIGGRYDKIKEENEYDGMAFITSGFLQGKTICDVQISQLGKGYNITIKCRRSTFSMPFTITQLKELKEEFMKIEEDLKAVI